jgi:pimeloyl-ACP methyl ester carboxylesterase/DNA-binding CsgD family transcriptional regulator
MEPPPVQYVTTSDGYNIAYCTAGNGRTFMMAPLPHSHLQLNWIQPGEQLSMMSALAARYRLVQYDARGQGLSTRDLPEDVSCEAFLRDMETVVDRLALGSMVLYGWGNAMGHVAVHYASRHPEKVDALVLQCSAARASAWPSSLFVDMPAQSWEYYLLQVARARAESNLRLAPGTPTLDLNTMLDGLQKSVRQRDWQLTLKAFLDDDATELLRNLRVPALVLHQRDFPPLPVEEVSRLAALIPNGRLVLTEGSSIYGDAAVVVKAIGDFIASLPASAAEPVTSSALPDHLSRREVDVLRLIAAGKSNAQIADELVISQNTVIRHVSNIFAKIGAANRAEAASYATRNGLA